MTEEQRHVLGILVDGGSVVRGDGQVNCVVTDKILRDDYRLELGVPTGAPGTMIERAAFEELITGGLLEPEGPETTNGKTVYRLTSAGRAALG